jgi:hypothetical protein
MQVAVAWAATKCPPDSICLLSTAAPSYSLWKDFEEKGDQFQAAVKAIPVIKTKEEAEEEVKAKLSSTEQPE